MKNYLKNNHYYTVKHVLKTNLATQVYAGKKKSKKSCMQPKKFSNVRKEKKNPEIY